MKTNKLFYADISLRCFSALVVDCFEGKQGFEVELDGSQHYEPTESARDQARTDYLQTQGIRVLRFSNLDVLRRFEDVCAEIDRVASIRAGFVP